MIVAADGEVVRPKFAAPSPSEPHGMSVSGEPSWREIVKRAVRDPAVLVGRLSLPSQWIAPAQTAAAVFPLFVPEPYLARIRPGDPADPLLRQVLPLGEELDDAPGYSFDPVGDLPALRAAGMLHKYPGRVLLVTTGACAIHCRYCFRRHFPYSDAPHGVEAWAPALAEIAADPTVDEVILSGGDPLMLSDSFLAELANQIAAIPTVARLRVHTRLPIVIPQRVTAELLAVLRSTRLAPVMVVHVNHPREIDESVAAALAKIVDAGVPVLNQAVLLRGVNDDAGTLVALCRRLANLRVMPYYLHRLDRVAGAAHFDVPAERGRQLVEDLRCQLPGYAVPRFVEETPSAPSKTPLAF